MGRGRKKAKTKQRLAQVSLLAAESRGRLKPCDLCLDHGLEFPHGYDPLAFREAALGTVLRPRLARWTPSPLHPRPAEPGGRGCHPGTLRGDLQGWYLLYPLHVVAAVDFAAHASAVDLKHNLESKPLVFQATVYLHFIKSFEFSATL